jgi:hypothetical protein
MPLQLINTEITDEFYINTNAWQYIDPWLSGNGNFVKYRVVVNASRGGGDNGNITVRFGGIWTKLTQEYIEVVYDLVYRVEDQDITKNDLKTNPVFALEYHTEGFQNPNDGIFVSRSISFLLDFLFNLVDIIENPSEVLEVLSGNSVLNASVLFNTYSVALDENIKFGASPVVDVKKGIIIPMDMVLNDTTVLMRIHGLFGKYNRDGEIQQPKIHIDKAAVLYEFEVPVEVKSTSYIDPNTLDFFYVAYEVEIGKGFVNLEIPIPDDYILLDDDSGWGLIESPRLTDITHYWRESVRENEFGDYINEPLFSEVFVRIDARIIFFERTGTYRFWFRVQNYGESLEAKKFDGSVYNIFDTLEMERITNYTMTLRNFEGQISKADTGAFNGSFYMEVRGESFNGLSDEFLGPIDGYHHNYTAYNNETELFETRWDKFKLLHNHTFTDGLNGNGLWGDLKFIFIWISLDQKHIGFTTFTLSVMRVANEPPIMSIVDPQQEERWGANTINYMIVKAYHINTVSVQAQFIGDATIHDLINLDDAINDPNFEGVIPPDLITVPIGRRFLYWFKEFSGNDLANLYPPEEGSSTIEVDIKGTSNVGLTNYTSDPVRVTFELVDRSDFELLPVFDIFLNQRVLLKYYSPEGISTMRVYIFDGINQILISVIGNGSESVYLYEGIQSYVIPFRFTLEGQYSIIVEVIDDVDNFMIFESNPFFVFNDDDRPWYVRMLDETFQVLGIWASFTLSILGIGLTSLKKKYKHEDKYRMFEMDNLDNQRILEGLL